MSFFNQHVHTVHSDGKATMAETVTRAEELAFSALTFADHAPVPEGCLEGVTSINRLIPEDYKAAFAALPPSNVELSLGIETEYVEGTEDFIRAEIADPAYDVVIASVHFLGDYDQVVECVDRFENSASRYRSLRELYCEYFRAQRLLCEMGGCQILAHMDNVSKQNGGVYFSESEDEYRAEVRATLQALKKSGMAYEVNTSGVLKPAGRPMPDRWICEEAFALGIPVTVTTDAHSLDTLDLHMPEARAVLRDIGYRELAIVRKRDLEFIPL